MRVLITGGGTAGHINPGLAIAKFIKSKDENTEIIFVGTQKGLETKLVPREGFELKTIRVRGFRRKLSMDTFVTIKELFQGILEARKVIREFKPDVVIGTGGYVCGPVVFNASLMKIPTMIHEQNAFPGVTNRILSRFANAVAISFKESTKYFKNAKKLVLTGNPIRNEVLMAERTLARQKLKISSDAQLVVIFGGSRGAEKINESVVQMALEHYKASDCNVIFAPGEAQYEKIVTMLGNQVPQTFSVAPYIYNMGEVLAASDLVICRAGAITISELTALGIPSIIIPSPYVTANHQEHNARALEEQGAAVVILEKNLNGNILYQQMTDLVKNKEQLGKMGKNAKKMGVTNASEKIYAMIQEIIRKE
ncbi:MAG: undecaprenyldiphospho-muramoylpentapeptide beta-N-acetylglucosaminyltransferase [Clostridia bacterium]|nr:undecaprenyldiphospho-muramoylpentapeptide beta-N-acetylglucosaminyltransferase [Clostridia bacterium]